MKKTRAKKNVTFPKNRRTNLRHPLLLQHHLKDHQRVPIRLFQILPVPKMVASKIMVPQRIEEESLLGHRPIQPRTYPWRGRGQHGLFYGC